MTDLEKLRFDLDLAIKENAHHLARIEELVTLTQSQDTQIAELKQKLASSELSLQLIQSAHGLAPNPFAPGQS